MRVSYTALKCRIRCCTFKPFFDQIFSKISRLSYTVKRLVWYINAGNLKILGLFAPYSKDLQNTITVHPPLRHNNLSQWNTFACQYVFLKRVPNSNTFHYLCPSLQIKQIRPTSRTLPSTLLQFWRVFFRSVRILLLLHPLQYSSSKLL